MKALVVLIAGVFITKYIGFPVDIFGVKYPEWFFALLLLSCAIDDVRNFYIEKKFYKDVLTKLDNIKNFVILKYPEIEKTSKENDSIKRGFY